jgi:hypothetical protein
VTKRGRLVVALVCVLALGSACVASKETRDGAKELRDRLGTPSWASSVGVKTGVDGQFEDFVQITVTAKRSADPSDLTGFVVALPKQAAAAGLGESAGYGLDFVWPSGARLSMDWEPQVVADEVLRGMTEWWLIATANIDLDRHVAATLRSDGGASYVISLGDGEPTEVWVAYSVVGALSQPDTAWQVTATSGALRLDLSASTFPTVDQLATWDHLVAAVEKLPADLPATLVSLHLFDRTVADFAFTAPDDTTAETFTALARHPTSARRDGRPAGRVVLLRVLAPVLRRAPAQHLRLAPLRPAADRQRRRVDEVEPSGAGVRRLAVSRVSLRQRACGTPPSGRPRSGGPARRR